MPQAFEDLVLGFANRLDSRTVWVVPGQHGNVSKLNSPNRNDGLWWVMRGPLQEPIRIELKPLAFWSVHVDQAWMRRKRSRPKSWRCASIVGSLNSKGSRWWMTLGCVSKWPWTGNYDGTMMFFPCFLRFPHHSFASVLEWFGAYLWI